MGVKIVTPPATEPVTLAEAKLHLRVDTDDDDAMITRLISAARAACEHELGRSVSPQTLLLTLDAFPSGAILLPRGPIISVDSVGYVDLEGVLQTIAGANYALDDTQVDAWLLPAYDYEWPDSREQANAVRVQYQAGMQEIPEEVQQWILLCIGTLYANREADSDRPALPQGFAARLLDRYRVHAL